MMPLPEPSNAALAICETLMSLYGPAGEWLADEEGTSRLWRMLQVVNNAPRVPGERWAPDEAIMRAFASRMTGKTVEEVTDPLSRFLHELKYREIEEVCDECGNRLSHCEANGCAMANYYHTESTPGVVVTDLGAWEGGDGG